MTEQWDTMTIRLASMRNYGQTVAVSLLPPRLPP